MSELKTVAIEEGGASGDFRTTNEFLLGYFGEKDGALTYRYDAERVIIEPWGRIPCASVPRRSPKCRESCGRWRGTRSRRTR